jgi:fructokinase
VTVTGAGEQRLREPHLILGIGELLWDIVADDKAVPGTLTGAPVQTLGGAPANFTVMAGRLGNHAAILSRIGRDELGRQAVDRLDPLPVDTSLLEVDSAHETGRVTVSFAQGEPQYTIHQPAAWDFLELSDGWVKMAERADVICFGTLAQRATESRQTIQTVAAETPASCIRIFDVNLRAPFYSGEVLQESLELATVVKMNGKETPMVLQLLGLAPNEEPLHDSADTKYLRSGAERLLEEFPALDLVAITRGGHGSLLVRREEWHEHPGFPVKVADPIGAGDAFTAAMAHYLLRGANLVMLNEAGNRWGAWVASQPGGMPELPEAVWNAISAAIERVA